MHHYPHTRLFFHLHRVVVLSGPHIQVLDAHGLVLHSTAKFIPENEEAVAKSGPIRCSGISKDAKYLATTGDDKLLKVWDLESLAILSVRMLPKKPTSIEFSGNMDILISDKFGDIFRYELHPNNKLEAESTTSDPFTSHENPSGGVLVLGHASLLTTFLLTPDEKFVITADRDEHIRVSWYPEGYNIESYCLGHTKYVSAIHIPETSPANLISGGGDLELKIWDWMTGRLLRDVVVFAAVEPFIKVKAQRRRHLLSENDEDDDMVESKAEMIKAEVASQRIDDNLKLCESDAHRSLKDSDTPPSPTELVFVVRRITSFLSAGETHVVFSVVGATAIFEFSLAKTDGQPDVRHFDFGQPVIDFTISAEGLIRVLLDANFSEEPDVSDERPRRSVKAVQWSIDQFADAGSSPLLDALNTICSLPATAEDLKKLDLYSDLTSLPKRTDGEQGQSQLTSDHLENKPTGEDASATVMTKRALGRLKHKRALDQLHHKNVDDCDIPGPDTKKPKAGSDDEGSYSM